MGQPAEICIGIPCVSGHEFQRNVAVTARVFIQVLLVVLLRGKEVPQRFRFNGQLCSRFCFFTIVYFPDFSKLAELSKEMTKLREELDSAYAKWEGLQEL